MKKRRKLDYKGLISLIGIIAGFIFILGDLYTLIFKAGTFTYFGMLTFMLVCMLMCECENYILDKLER